MSARSLKNTTTDNEMLPQGTKQHNYWKIKVLKIKIKQKSSRKTWKIEEKKTTTKLHKIVY